jgi:hypothetical protein
MSIYHLYSSEGCHLCELAMDICQPLLKDTIKVIDIVEDDRLVELYGVHIPVLECVSSGEKLFWPFDTQQVITLMKCLNKR